MVSQTGWSPVPLMTRRRRGRAFLARASKRSFVGSVETGPRATTTTLSAVKAVKGFSVAVLLEVLHTTVNMGETARWTCGCGGNVNHVASKDVEKLA